MTAIRSFIRTCVMGGLVVLLPIGIFIAFALWVYNFLYGMLRPLISQVTKAYPNLTDVAAFFVSMLIVVALCFVVGLILRWRIGRFVHQSLEDRILRIAPGYNLIKETVMQFLGNRPSPFSSVALVRIFGNDTLVTAFVTETHENGYYSVFVPTGPNPTSGNIYHLKPEYVHHIDHPVEDVMRSIISCGAGSDKLIKAWEAKRLEGDVV